MTLTVGAATCGTPERHEWVLRSIDFEEIGPVSVFECRLCGGVDHRVGVGR
jgi:hypothetical protein